MENRIIIVPEIKRWILVLILQLWCSFALTRTDKEELRIRYNSEYTVVMICKKYLIQNNFCVERVAQVRVNGFITKGLLTLICRFRTLFANFSFLHDESFLEKFFETMSEPLVFLMLCQLALFFSFKLYDQTLIN